jgi:hypothetical protein
MSLTKKNQKKRRRNMSKQSRRIQLQRKTLIRPQRVNKETFRRELTQHNQKEVAL